jgi:hypothetical protein
MNKKIYSTPLIEQTECLGMSNLCDVSFNAQASSPEQSGDNTKPGSVTAPKRVMF